MNDWIKLAEVAAGTAGLLAAFMFVSPTFCRLAIRRLQVHERALSAFYAVYAQSADADRAARAQSIASAAPAQWSHSRRQRRSRFQEMFSPTVVIVPNEEGGAQ